MADESEHNLHLPERLLGAIAIVESGRYDPHTHQVEPWPWSVDIGGTGYFFSSKQSAVTFVAAARSIGVRSIDVGCMQVNLMYHPDAFADLDEAFAPRSNARYAARFLNALYVQTGNWTDATAAYHSQTPGIGAPYAARVSAVLPWKLEPGTVPVADLRATIARKVDPYGVLTPQFRDYLISIEIDKAGRHTG